MGGGGESAVDLVNISALPAVAKAPTQTVQKLQGDAFLRNSADWRCILWIAKYFVLSTLAWSLGDCNTSLPLYLLTLLVLSYYSFAGATIVHNTMHCRCFKNKMLEHIWHHLL